MPRYVELAFNLPVRKLFTYALPDGTEAAVGCRAAAPFGARALTGLVTGLRDSPPEGVTGIREVRRVVDARPLFGESTLDLARWMARMYMCSLGEALFSMLPGGRRESETDELPLDEEPRGYQLAPQQKSAIETITGKGEGSFYLFGVTGSGKTDVYLSVAQHVTASGRGVIYLVPEISLTHQVVRVFHSIYRTRLAVLHSALTPSQRLKEWLRVLDGEVDVVIGARSAIFAPFARLGLVVIDEEHEGAYKSGSAPRYHARQVAMRRAAQENAILLMGSATPSLEAYHHMRQGGLTTLRLPDRLSGGELPRIEVVDMRRQRGPLSPRLLAEIEKTFAEGRQTILFLNRRGFSYFFHCRSCGYEMLCRHCSVALTYHRERGGMRGSAVPGRMICHYCGWSAEPIHVCPQCGSLDVGYSGYGTEGIEEEIQRTFPRMTVKRIDTDAVRKRRVLRQALADFRDGKIHLLLGTQMVAKGLNFPGVKLVGIVNADTGFQLPDFRAAERTFDLLVQVSGRAGRTLPDGTVLIQTFQPANPAIRLAKEGKLEEFYAAELDTRRALAFPPFSRLIRIVVRSSTEKKGAAAAADLGRDLAARLAGAAEVLGPAECPISRISGSFRTHLIVRTSRFAETHERVSALLEGLAPASGVHIEIDVDPLALL
jgi:primosomal protein N' (replication factor Y) (superfamily II helicase)